MRVLVVEDERRLAAGLRAGLQAEGFAVDVAPDGTDGLWLAREKPYDVILLDVMLPGLNGMELCATLRREGNWTPVVMLTARDGARDQIRGLDCGADDYITKPFSFAVLVARLRAAIRRGAVERPAQLSLGDLSYDPATRATARGDVDIELTSREAAVLECLLRAGDSIVTKQQILDHVWNDDFEGGANIVEVYVRHLRNKIDRPFGRESIVTVRGAGYRMVDDG